MAKKKPETVVDTENKEETVDGVKVITESETPVVPAVQEEEPKGVLLPSGNLLIQA